MMAFSRPCDPQAASNLIQLPTELLLKIAQYLLHFPGVLHHDKSYVSKRSVKFHRAKVKAGCRLMQTCQLMHRECNQILFNENEVKLSLRSFDFNDHTHPISYHAQLCYLDQTIAVDVPGLSTCPTELDSEESYKAICVRPKRNGSRNVSANSFRAMSRFSRTLIDLKGQHCPSMLEFMVFWLCRVFYFTLKDKSVTFVVDEGTDPRHLYGCKTMQCRSVRVIGCKPSPDLEKFVTRILPVDDTYRRWRYFHENFVRKLPTISCTECSDHHEEVFNRIQTQAVRYNTKRYLKMEQLVVDRAKTWIHYWHLNEEATAKSMIKLLKTRTQEIQSVLSEMAHATSDNAKLLTVQNWQQLPLGFPEPLWMWNEFEDLSRQIDDQGSELPSTDGDGGEIDDNNVDDDDR